MANRRIEEIRELFPVLTRESGEEPLVYLDSAATALTPLPVIEAIDSYYRNNSSNIHRGLYRLSEEASRLYEEGRTKVARFIGATSPEEVVFTHGTTESINLLAYSWGANLGPEDLIVATEMEHHANLIPWQQLSRRNGPSLEHLPVDPQSGELSFEDHDAVLEKQIPERTALVAITGMSNVTGLRPPIERIVRRAREVGAKVLVDAAQLAAHEALNVQDLDVDFLVFSGHKLYGPTGIGVLWARSGTLDNAPPFMTGGGMIKQVGLGESSFRSPPQRFEAGTPHIAGVAGLSAAIDFLDSLGWEEIVEHERTCTRRLLDVLAEFEGIEVYGPRDPEKRSSVVSFNVSNVHPHDVGTLLSERGIAVRAGLHCAQPYVEKLGSGGTVRASLAVYSTLEDIESLGRGIAEVSSIFG